MLCADRISEKDRDLWLTGSGFTCITEHVPFDEQETRTSLPLATLMTRGVFIMSDLRQNASSLRMCGYFGQQSGVWLERQRMFFFATTELTLFLTVRCVNFGFWRQYRRERQRWQNLVRLKEMFYGEQSTKASCYERFSGPLQKISRQQTDDQSNIHRKRIKTHSCLPKFPWR